MEFAVRPYAATAAALVVGGLIAAAPVAATLPGTSLHTVTLTTDSSLSDVLSQQLQQNSALFDGMITSNTALTTGQIDQIPSIASFLTSLATSDPTGFQTHAASDGMEQFFNANNALTGMAQAWWLGLLGVRGTVDDSGNFTSLDLTDLNSSLLTDIRHTNSIPFAGFESAIGHYTGAFAFISAIYDGSTSGSEVENGATGTAFTTLLNTVTAFNTDLVSGEQGFNASLVAAELALEKAIFGNTDALNGAVNSAFNSFNMMFDGTQQSLNGFLGITDFDPQEQTAGLLVNAAAGNPLTDGSIGGLQGMFDQSSAMWNELFSATSSDWNNLFANFDADAFNTASQQLFSALFSSPFGDAFSAGGSFSDVLNDLFGMFSAGA